jgi:hypothetical protein
LQSRALILNLVVAFGRPRLPARACGFLVFLFSRLNTLCTLPAGLGLRSECRVVLVAALAPLQQAINPCSGLADRFCDLPLCCALLFGSRDVIGRGTQRGLAGFDCLLGPAQQLGDAHHDRPRRERDFFRRFGDAVVVCSSATTDGMLLVGEL